MELGDSLNLRKYPFMCVGNKLLIPKIIPHKKIIIFSAKRNSINCIQSVGQVHCLLKFVHSGLLPVYSTLILTCSQARLRVYT